MLTFYLFHKTCFQNRALSNNFHSPHKYKHAHLDRNTFPLQKIIIPKINKETLGTKMAVKI